MIMKIAKYKNERLKGDIDEKDKIWNGRPYFPPDRQSGFRII